MTRANNSDWNTRDSCGPVEHTLRHELTFAVTARSNETWVVERFFGNGYVWVVSGNNADGGDEDDTGRSREGGCNGKIGKVANTSDVNLLKALNAPVEVQLPGSMNDVSQTAT